MAENKKDIKKVVLLSGCHGVANGGLKHGLMQENVLLYNYALGGTYTLQRLYELKRHEDIAKNADLIILESASNDIGSHESALENASLELIYKQNAWLYEELYRLHKKVVVLLVARLNLEKFHKPVNNIHLSLAKKYGFNVIDTQKAFSKNENLRLFWQRYEPIHPMNRIMKELGANIIKNIANFKEPKIIDAKVKLPQFEICYPKDMLYFNASKLSLKENSFFKEEVYDIKDDEKLQFPSKYKGYKIIGFHTWHKDTQKDFHFVGASMLVYNKNDELVVSSYNINNFHTVKKPLMIDEETIVKFNSKQKASTEHSWAPYMTHPLFEKLNNLLLISFFLAKNDDMSLENVDLESLKIKDISIDENYDFYRLIPDVELYKDIIEQYNWRMDPGKLNPLKKQIADLNKEKSLLQNTINSLPHKIDEENLKIKKLQVKELEKKLGLKFSKLEPKIVLNLNEDLRNSAVARFKNHLCFKLGEAMIENSKSFKGFLRMPFVLSYIKDKHKKEQKNYALLVAKNPDYALPDIENLKDYEEGLRVKNYLSYKLGEALIKASNNAWGGGGDVKFIFTALRLKKQFKKS